MLENLYKFFKGYDVKSIEVIDDNQEFCEKCANDSGVIGLIDFIQSIERSNSIKIKTINPNGIYVDKLDKNKNRTIYDHVMHLVQNGKGTHYIFLNSTKNISRILSYFPASWEEEDSDGFFSLEWHPDYLSMMPAKDTVYIGDFLGTEYDPPKQNTRIFLQGYEYCNEKDVYFEGFEYFSTDPMEILISDNLSKDNLRPDDFISVYDPSLIDLKEKLFEL